MSEFLGFMGEMILHCLKFIGILIFIVFLAINLGMLALAWWIVL